MSKGLIQKIKRDCMFLADNDDGEKKLPNTVLHTSDIYHSCKTYNENDENLALFFDSIYIRTIDDFSLIDIGYSPYEKIEIKHIEKRNIYFYLPSYNYTFSFNFFSNSTVFDAESHFAKEFITIPQNINILYNGNQLSDDKYLFDFDNSPELPFIIVPQKNYQLYYTFYDQFNFILMKDDSTLKDFKDSISSKYMIYSSIIFGKRLQDYFNTTDQTTIEKSNLTLNELSKDINIFDFDFNIIKDKKLFSYEISIFFEKVPYSIQFKLPDINANSTVYLITCILEGEFQIDRGLFIPFDQDNNRIELNSSISSQNHIHFKVFNTLQVKIEDKNYVLPYLTTIGDIKKMFKFNESNFGIIINNHFVHDCCNKSYLTHLMKNINDDPNKVTEIIFKRPIKPCHIQSFTNIKEQETKQFIVPDDFSIENVADIYLNQNIESIEITKRMRDEVTNNLEYEYKIKENKKMKDNKKINIIYIDASNKSSEMMIELKGNNSRVIDLLYKIKYDTNNIFLTMFMKRPLSKLEAYFDNIKLSFTQNLDSIPYCNNNNKITVKEHHFKKDDSKTSIIKIHNFENNIVVNINNDNITVTEIIDKYIKICHPTKDEFMLFLDYCQLEPNDHPLICAHESNSLIYNEINDIKPFTVSNGTDLKVPIFVNKINYCSANEIISGMFGLTSLQFSFTHNMKEYILPKDFNAGALPDNSEILVNYEYIKSDFITFRFFGKSLKIKISNVDSPISIIKPEIHRKLNINNNSPKSIYFAFYDFILDENKSFSYYRFPEDALISVYFLKSSFQIKLKMHENYSTEYKISPSDSVGDLKKLIKDQFKYNQEFELSDEKGQILTYNETFSINTTINLICRKKEIHSQGSLGNDIFKISEILTVKQCNTILIKKLNNKSILIFTFNNFNQCYEKVDTSKRLFEIDSELFVHQLFKLNSLQFDDKEVTMNFKENHCISELNTLQWLKENYISNRILSLPEHFYLTSDGEKLDENKTINEIFTSDRLVKLDFSFPKQLRRTSSAKIKSQTIKNYKPKIIQLTPTKVSEQSEKQKLYKKHIVRFQTEPQVEKDKKFKSLKKDEINTESLIYEDKEEDNIGDEITNEYLGEEEENSLIGCTFYSADNTKKKFFSFTENNSEKIIDFLNIQFDFFLIYNSKGEVEDINNDNYKEKLKNKEKYFIAQFPYSLENNRKSLISNPSNSNKKLFYKGLIDHLKTTLLEFKQLLCIIYKLDRSKKQQRLFLMHIQKNHFTSLFFFTQQFYNESKKPIILREFLLPFIISMQLLKKDNSQSYFEALDNLYTNSPFRPLTLRKLFFCQEVEPNSIVQIDDNIYGLFQGQADDEPNQSVYYDPYENAEVKFDFADYFLRSLSNDSKTINFEDIFFDTREYELTSKSLGSGNFGTLKIAKRIKDDKIYGAKVINTRNTFNGKDQKLFMRESMILQKLHHPSIVNFKGINFQSFENMERLQPTILTELLKKGSLQKVLESKKIKTWSPTKKYILLLGISNAIRYLHKHGIIHRDLKPANILIDENDYPQICDFGNSRCFPDALTKSKQFIMSEYFGSPLYNAPEVFDDENEDKNGFGTGIDVYSFSIIAFEIISEEPPYKKTKAIGTFLKNVLEGARPEFNDMFSEKMKNLLKKCWSPRPAERPSFDEIYEQLSTDFSYSKSEVDINVIQNYIRKLNQIPNSPNQVIMNHIKVEVNDIENIFFDTNDYRIITDKPFESEIFSNTYLAESTNIEDKTIYSAQVINTDIFKGYDQMILMRESILLNKLKHNFIIKFYGLNFQSFYDEDKIKPTIINEYLSNGSLSKFIPSSKLKHNSNFVPLNYSQKVIILCGVADAMNFIHKYKIVFGFLSPKNILLDENFHPRIRFPHSFSDTNQRELIVKFGLKRYLAPEIFDSEQEYGMKIDIYAFAILMYEILTDREAFCDVNKDSIQFNIVRGIRPFLPSDFQEQLKNLIDECWNEKAEQRPSFDKIHETLLEYFSKVDEIKNEFNQFFKNLSKKEADD